MNLLPVLRQRYFDADGNPLAGGKLYTYQAGTTTPQATYTDSTGSTPNANPVVLDANGEATLWVDPELSYKFVLKTSADVTQWTVDNVVGLLTNNSVGTNSVQDEAITEPKLADNAASARVVRSSVSTDADRAITTNHLRDGLLTGPKLASSVADNSTIELSGTSLRVKDAGITWVKRAARSVSAAATSGNIALAAADNGNQSVGTSWTALTSQSVTLVTHGSAVWLQLMPSQSVDPDANTAFGLIRNSSTTWTQARFKRDGTVVGNWNIVGAGDYHSCTSVQAIDTPAAGTHTYTIEVRTGSGNVNVDNVKLMAREL